MQKTVKIVHIITSLEVGGAQTVLCTLLDELKMMNHEVWYIHDGPVKQDLSARHVPVRQLTSFLGSYSPFTMICLMWWLWRAKPDCVHTLLWSANFLGRIACWILRLRCVSGFHNHKKQDGWLRNALDRYTNYFVQDAIAVSDEVKQSLTDWCHVSPQKVQVVVNGIKVHKVSEPTQIIGPFEPGTFVFGSVGRLEPVKEFDLLISSFRQLYELYPQARLLLVGGGSQEQHLKRLAQELQLGDAILFTGTAPAPRYVPFMDCFVMSSGQEGVSMALLYAMSCGLCCVVRHPTEHHPVITNGKTGIVVANNGPKNLAQAMEEVMVNAQQRELLGARGRQAVAEGFCEQVMVNKYEKIFTNG